MEANPTLKGALVAAGFPADEGRLAIVLLFLSNQELYSFSDFEGEWGCRS